jgi:hypothetical protein
MREQLGWRAGAVEASMELDRIDQKAGQSDTITPEKYILMNEREKDMEIEKAVARLQKRIQEILYAIEIRKQKH